MKKANYYNNNKIEAPDMLACWAGMGNVGLGAAEYMRVRLKAGLFCEIGIDDIVSPEAVSIRKGLSSLPKVPSLSLYYSNAPRLAIALGKEQFYGKAGLAVMSRLLDVARDIGVKRIYTGAAFPTYMSHRDPSTVYAAANSRALLTDLGKSGGLRAMSDGQVSGLNGLLLESARKRRIEAACLLATMPMYGVSFPNPKASKALLEALSARFGTRIDPAGLDISINEVDKMFEKIEDQLKHLGLKEEAREEPQKEDLDEVPKTVFDKIERLFLEAGKDKKLVHRLKEELDRWDLFAAYEDRFLDLFKENQ
jgi:proteasome assembly chaperone (PAC2) family protein